MNLSMRRPKLDAVAAGILSSFTAAMAYGAASVIGRKVVTEYTSPLVSSLFALSVGVLTMFVFSIGSLGSDLKAPRKAYLHLALAGLGAMVGVTCLFTALQKAPVSVVTPVSSLTPMFSLLFTHLFLSRLEKVTRRTVMGTSLVLAGVLLVSLSTLR